MVRPLRFFLPAVFALIPTVLGCGSSEPSAPDDPTNPDDVEGLDPDDPNAIPGGKLDSVGAEWPSAGPLPEQCDLDQPFQAFFTPDDPTVSLELALIRKVREAAKEQGAAPEGENPFRIRYAVYNMTHTQIAAELASAERDGVDVQVLIEADQLAKEWVQVDDIFEQQGLEVVRNHHALQDSYVSVDLVGIDDPGLMHLKTRLFEMPGWSAMLTGSVNPNASAGANEETLHLTRQPELIARYAEAYESVLHGWPIANRWDDGAPVNVLFSPAGEGMRASTRLLEWLDQEQEQILIMVFSLRDVTSPNYGRSLVEILSDKVAQGVPVWVITDRKQSDGVDMWGSTVYYDDGTDDRLRAAGVPVYECVNDASAYFGEPYPYAAMHHKAAVLGKSRIRVITDAANWTNSGLGSRRYPARNVESQLFIDSLSLDDNLTGRRYMGQWLRVLGRYAYQSAERDGEMSAVDASAKLMGLGGWPAQPLLFRAEAETSYGETVYATGSDPLLGDWGSTGPGVALSTDSGSYPTWRSESAAMPLGKRFEWKLTARKDAAVRWESGGNRMGEAFVPACAVDAGETELGAVWR